MSNETFKGYAIHSTDNYTDFKVIEFAPKEAGEYDIDIKINVCGICSSDVHTLTGGWGQPILPLVSGHEIAGVVTRVGTKVTEFKVGDRAGVGAQVGACYECKLCKSDNENYCPKQVDTYNAKYSNGDIAHGGYSNAIRVHERFVFALPESLTDENVASMLCAGLTVWAPLRRFNVGPGSKVAVAGIGGLGHYAVQFASALGADVTAISHQADKEADVRQMGAKHFINTTSKDFAASHAGSFDLILSTIDDVAGLPLKELISMLTLNGRFHTCGLPDSTLPPLHAMDLASNAASISVSHIGSKKEAYEMLAFAAKHQIKTWATIIDLKDVGKGVQAVKENKARYRFVMKQDLE